MTGIFINIAAKESPERGLAVGSEMHLFSSDQESVAKRELEQRYSEFIYKSVCDAVQEATRKLRDDPESFVRLSDEIADGRS